MNNLEKLLTESKIYHLEKIAETALKIKEKTIWIAEWRDTCRLIKEYEEYKEEAAKGYGKTDDREAVNCVIDEINKRIRDWKRKLSEDKEDAMSVWNDALRLRRQLNRYKIGLGFIDSELDNIQEERRKQVKEGLDINVYKKKGKSK